MIHRANIPRLSSVHASVDPVRPLTRLPVFFLLVFARSIPRWLIGGATELHVMPGPSVSALNGFCPLAAALILVYQEIKNAEYPSVFTMRRRIMQPPVRPFAKSLNPYCER